MHKIAFLFLTLSLVLHACKQDNKGTSSDKGSTATVQALAGAWVADEFSTFAIRNKSILKTLNEFRNPYAYALTFDITKPDQVSCNNGMESWDLPIKIVADTIEVKNAMRGQSIFLIYNSQSDKKLAMFDGTKSPMEINYFKKTPASSTATAYQAFLSELNKGIFGGGYYKAGDKQKAGVFFREDGNIEGLDYNKYELCTRGDCFVSGSTMDVMRLFKTEEPNATFMGYRISAKGDSLTLYNLINEKPEEKGVYAIGAPAYRLLKQ